MASDLRIYAKLIWFLGSGLDLFLQAVRGMKPIQTYRVILPSGKYLPDGTPHGRIGRILLHFEPKERFQTPDRHRRASGARQNRQSSLLCPKSGPDWSIA